MPSHRFVKPQACVWLGCEISNRLLYLASGIVQHCDKQSSSTDPLLGGAVFPGRTSGRSCNSRSTDCVAAARDRHHHRWILVGNSRKAASLLTAWKLSRPFPHRLLRRFCTSDCLRPRPRCRRLTCWEAGLPVVPTHKCLWSRGAAIADARSNE